MTHAQAASGGARLGAALRRLDVPALFTLCGGHISPILVGARQAGVRVIDVRDEAAAVFAADALARLTGGIGVAAVTAGPGVANAITALKNAQLAQSPVVLLGGGAPTVLRGRGALQDIDQLALVRPHVKWAARARRAADLVPLLYRAVRAARSGVPGPVFLECPADLLYPEALVHQWYEAGSGAAPRSVRARAERWYLRRHLARMFGGPPADAAPPPVAGLPALPPVASLGRAARLLARGRRPVLLIGSQAVDPVTAPALLAAVEQLGMPTFLSGMARGLLGRSHPLLLRHRRREALRAADLVILAGVPCDFRLDYGRHLSRATVIALNLSRREARLNRRPAVTLVAHPGHALAALAARAAGHDRGSAWMDECRERDDAREREIADRAATASERVNPMALCRAIDAIAGDDSVFVLDGGDFAATAAYILAPRGPLRHLDAGPLGTLGAGGGFVLGAAVARPGAEIWLLYGDGAAAFSLAEFDTFVRHGIPVIAVVGNDASWTQIAREQVPALGDDVGTTLRAADYHLVAQGYGGQGILVSAPADVAAALRQARALAAAGSPVLVNVLLDRSDFRQGSISM
jgi:thiamine pyrophosphate-dependent acetolactate synthase large subunit-like protein